MHVIRSSIRLAGIAIAAVTMVYAQAPATAQLPPETREFFDAASMVTGMAAEWSGKIHSARDATSRPEALKPRRVLKNSVILITGGAASGAALGAALSRNARGALIGAMAGGFAGFLYDRITFRDPEPVSPPPPPQPN